jgi:predicted glycoside hydrolase/deacetylase ChbG (UPF0249 family)
VKRLVVCADDFGQSEAIDAAVLRLAGAGVVTAVSCLAAGPSFHRDAPALLGSGAEVGVHLDLTDGTDGAPPVGLGRLIALSHLRALDGAVVERRLEAQLGAFERVTGRAPAFVDGHRHVHQLPVVRARLLSLLERRWPGRALAVRNTVPLRGRGAKASLIAALGGRSLRRLLVARGVPHNADFAGVYDFDPGASFPRLVQTWLASLADGGLLMCHPADPGDDIHASARVAERDYLASPGFEADCLAAGVRRVGFAALG